MYSFKKGSLLLTSLIFLSCLNFSCREHKVIETLTPPPSIQYFIGPDDILSINVWKEPELSQTVPVRPDGKISLPLVHDVQAAGFTPHQLKDELTKKLSKFISEPTVTVTVTTVNSLKIFVIGNVNSPGTIQVQQEINIIQAISLAGGLNEWAKQGKIKIVRIDGNVEKRFKVSYNRILKGKEPNIPVYPGDTIIVP